MQPDHHIAFLVHLDVLVIWQKRDAQYNLKGSRPLHGIKTKAVFLITKQMKYEVQIEAVSAATIVTVEVMVMVLLALLAVEILVMAVVFENSVVAVLGAVEIAVVLGIATK